MLPLRCHPECSEGSAFFEESSRSPAEATQTTEAFRISSGHGFCRAEKQCIHTRLQPLAEFLSRPRQFLLLNRNVQRSRCRRATRPGPHHHDCGRAAAPRISTATTRKRRHRQKQYHRKRRSPTAPTRELLPPPQSRERHQLNPQRTRKWQFNRPSGSAAAISSRPPMPDPRFSPASRVVRLSLGHRQHRRSRPAIRRDRLRLESTIDPFRHVGARKLHRLVETVRRRHGHQHHPRIRRRHIHARRRY